MTWTLSGFADEISPELDEQLDTLEAESIRYLELRSVWDTNVANLTDEQIERVATRLAERGFRVSSIGSPVGKVDIREPFAAERSRAERILQVAQRLEAPTVRVFSFSYPAGTKPDDHRDQILDYLGQLAEMAEAAGVVLAHENEQDLYGDVPERCFDLLQSVNSPALRSTFDAGNFVQCGIRPFDQAYELLRPYLVYVQIKDARRSDGEETPAGEGDGQIVQTLRALADSDFDGFFSLEPHLVYTHAGHGRSGPDLFRQASQALKGLLSGLGITWQ